MKNIALIYAVDENGLMGKDGKLPWHLPADVKHFKETTTGHLVIMGRKTYESIGKPLLNRTNIVISRSISTIPGCIVVHSVENVFELIPDEKLVFVIGGAEIYRQFRPHAQFLYMTRIHHEFEGDTYSPLGTWCSEWELISNQDFKADDKNLYDYSFKIYERKTRG